jgi:hypothetical protein
MIRVSIGAESMQLVNCRVLVSSILRRTQSDIDFSFSWSPEQGYHPLMKTLPKIKNGTKFALWRWLVPQLYDFSGGAIYLDSDQIVLADIAELWHSLPVDCGIAAVTDAIGVFGSNKKPEPGAVQTSVMVMDCSWNPLQFAAEKIADVAHGRLSYRNLMQAKWLPRHLIHSLPVEWNLFSCEHPNQKLIHNSHVASQPVRDLTNPTAELWGRELIETIRAGHLSMEELRSEVDQKHVNKHWMKLAKRECEVAV